MSGPAPKENVLIARAEFEKLTLSQIEWQIELRRKQMGSMVGWLYPSILRDEITTLNELRHRLKFGGPK